MRRAVVLVLLTGALAGIPGAAVAGGPPQHFSMVFDEPSESTYVDGLGAGCPDFTGMLREDRHLELEGWLKDDGTGHARTVVAAQVGLVPDDPAGVAFTGHYAQRQTGSFTAYGDDDRVVTTTTHGTLQGTDGSAIRIREVAHFSLDHEGNVRVWFDRLRCAG